MKYFKLIYLSVFFGIVSILAFFNITYSYYLNLYLNLNTYIYTFIVSIFLAILFYYAKSNDEKKITIYEKILTILLGYFLLPLVISIPFYFSIYNLTFVNAFFESISGFTSTGFTIFDNINHIDQSLILWRSADLHNIKLWSMWLILSKIVKPVEVNPEIDSKKALTKVKL